MKSIPIRRLNTAGGNHEFKEAFGIRGVQDLLGGKDMVQDLHRHDYFYVLALEQGQGKHEIDFTSYPVRNHSVFFMRPGQVHQLQLTSNSTGYLMHFKSDFYHPTDKASEQLLRKASNKNLCALDAKRFGKLSAILKNIFREYRDQQEGYQAVIRFNLGIFFIELLRHQQSKNSLDGANTYTMQRLEAFLDLLDTHIFKQKQVSQYADMLHLSTYQLNAITKDALGKTSSEVINDRIIMESKRLLLATTNQVNQIAYHLGYEDASYFIRFFKKHTGYSPETFRNNFK